MNLTKIFLIIGPAYLMTYALDLHLDEPKSWIFFLSMCLFGLNLRWI